MIDLHVHSTCSDGTNTPEELVKMAGEIRLSALSITDHDTVDGIGAAIAAGNDAGVMVLPGIELSVTWQQLHVHLLGYGFDRHNVRLLEALRQIQESRQQRNEKIMIRLAELGLPVGEKDLETLAGAGQTGRPHIARMLVEKQIVRSMEQAFDRYLKRGAPAYVSRFVLSADVAFELLHQAGGIAVLAHPGQLPVSTTERETLIRELMDKGLDGIESYYPTHKGRIFKQLRTVADRFDLVETGGSDYHGGVRPKTAMAGRNGFVVPSELLVGIRNRLESLSQAVTGM